MKRRAVVLMMAMVAVLGLALGRATPAYAGAATDVVKGKQTAMFELLKQSSPANDAKLQGIFDEMLDYGSLAQASLGGEWAARTDAEKGQFSDLLKQLVRKAWERNLKQTLNFTIEYLGEETVDGAVMVKTKAMANSPDARDEPLEIAFKVGQKDATWRVQDIVTEGVSLVSSYRSQFTKIIKKDGFPALIQKMKDKIAKGDVR